MINLKKDAISGNEIDKQHPEYLISKQFRYLLIASILGLVAVTTMPIVRTGEEILALFSLVPDFVEYMFTSFNKNDFTPVTFILAVLSILSIIVITCAQYITVFGIIINRRYSYNVLRLLLILEMSLLYTSFYHSSVDNFIASTSACINTVIIAVVMLVISIKKINLHKTVRVLTKISLLCMSVIVIYLVRLYDLGYVFYYSSDTGMHFIYYFYDIVFIVFISIFIFLNIKYQIKKTSEPKNQ